MDITQDNQFRHTGYTNKVLVALLLLFSTHACFAPSIVYSEDEQKAMLYCCGPIMGAALIYFSIKMMGDECPDKNGCWFMYTCLILGIIMVLPGLCACCVGSCKLFGSCVDLCDESSRNRREIRLTPLLTSTPEPPYNTLPTSEEDGHSSDSEHIEAV